MDVSNTQASPSSELAASKRKTCSGNCVNCKAKKTASPALLENQAEANDKSSSTAL